MGFTASKEARNPDPDFVSGVIDGFGVVIEKSAEVSTEFLGDDILAEFLYETLLIILRHFDNAVNVAVNVLLEHILNLHLLPSG